MRRGRERLRRAHSGGRPRPGYPRTRPTGSGWGKLRPSPRPRAIRRSSERGEGDDAPARRERRRGDDRQVAQAAGRPCRQVRAAPRGHHRQGQRRGPVAVRGHPARRSWPRKGATVPNNAEIAVIETADDGATAALPAPAAPHRGSACGLGGRDPPAPMRRTRAVEAPPTPAAAGSGRAPAAPPSRRRRRRRDRRPRCPHDPGRPPPAPRARPVRRPDRRAPAAADGSPATTSWRSSRRSAPGGAAPVPAWPRPPPRRPATAPAAPRRWSGPGPGSGQHDRLPATAPTKSSCR